MKNGKNVHLKHDDANESQKWIEAITKLMGVYKDKPLLDFDINEVWKDASDPRIVNLIMEELESSPKLTLRREL